MGWVGGQSGLHRRSSLSSPPLAPSPGALKSIASSGISLHERARFHERNGQRRRSNSSNSSSSSAPRPRSQWPAGRPPLARPARPSCCSPQMTPPSCPPRIYYSKRHRRSWHSPPQGWTKMKWPIHRGGAYQPRSAMLCAALLCLVCCCC